MKNIIYVTTNSDKFHKAQVNLGTHGILLEQKVFEMQEIQSSSGEEIVKLKAQQAFQKFGKPLIVNDDTWSIPTLRGFPSTGMKLCNDFLKAEDWLRLMSNFKGDDRKVFLISYYVYHDGKNVYTITCQDERYFLNKPMGAHKRSPCLEVIARKGNKLSVAEEIIQGRKPEVNNKQFWSNFAKLLTN